MRACDLAHMQKIYMRFPRTKWVLKKDGMPLAEFIKGRASGKFEISDGTLWTEDAGYAAYIHWKRDWDERLVSVCLSLVGGPILFIPLLIFNGPKIFKHGWKL